MASFFTSSYCNDGSSKALMIHDVFLSFRGEDTRASFTSHLYSSLLNSGIKVFRDDDSLPRGDVISASLYRAIEQSRIAVIVFSKNYADSRWCLDELVKIMECYGTMGIIVLPVFYGVDPSEVRNRSGEFGKAYQTLLTRLSKKKVLFNMLNFKFGSPDLEREQGWSAALREVAGFAGFVVLNSRNESEAIKDIVEEVVRLLDKMDLFVANNPVGVEPRVQDMIELLYIKKSQEMIQHIEIQQSNDVLLLGVWGMGGIGKTTIAKAIYNKVGRNFEGRSFLAKVREVWEQKVGQVSLQEQLLFDICKVKRTKIQSIEAGQSLLKDRLCHKRVFIVLDDVNTLDQLNALCGSRRWFGSGSRIIITTRDMHILRGIGVNKVYPMKELGQNESIELFSWHAFKQEGPKEDFSELSKKVVEYSGGLPLSLEVLGSYLFNREVIEWEDVLDKLRKIPNDQVQKKLRISYDALNDDTMKEIFLDIACFFIGMIQNDVIHILNGCELYAEIGIKVLTERCLLTVDDRSRIGMHDLLRDMGREIVREKSPKNPEERSRLWSSEDVLDVLLEQTGTKVVEGITLRLPRANAKCFSTKAFKKMTRLKLLQLVGVKLDGNFEYLTKHLRWLSWNGFPLQSLPTSFYLGNLVSLELENSKVNVLWKDTQRLEKLKILNLSHSRYLTETPNFFNVPNLEQLVLIDCPRLTEISPTIGNLNKILLINLEDCIKLRNLPRSVYKLKSLKNLILSGCHMIEDLEEDLEQMDSLTNLIANDTGIRRIPFSVVKSKNIGFTISLCGYEGSSHDMFPSIIWSWMSPRNKLLSPFQSSSAMLSLVPLDILNCSSHELPSVSEYLPWLRGLLVKCNSTFQLSRDLARILDALYVTDSNELESTATSQVSDMKTSPLVQFSRQIHVSESKAFRKSLLIQIGRDSQVTNILKNTILQYMDINECVGGFYPDDSYPDWLTFDFRGSSVTFEVPRVQGRNLKAMMCVIYSSTPKYTASDGLKNLFVINYTKATIQLYEREAFVSSEDEEGEKVVSSMEPGNKVEVFVVFEKGFVVKKTIVYLVYDQPSEEKVKKYQEPDENVIGCVGDENECSVRGGSPRVERMDENGGPDSCCGLIKYSFIQWITNFMCRLVECWG